jgi:hypothetical protein
MGHIIMETVKNKNVSTAEHSPSQNDHASKRCKAVINVSITYPQNELHLIHRKIASSTDKNAVKINWKGKAIFKLV